MKEMDNGIKALMTNEYSSFFVDEQGNPLPEPEGINNAAKALAKIQNKSSMALAELLCKIYDNEFYIEYGHDNFENYVRQELDFSYRTATYLVKIWNNLVKEREIPKTFIENRSWSKLKEIANISGNDSIETEEITNLIEQTDDLTVSEVTVKAKELDNKVNDVDDLVEEVKRLSFNLYPEQKKVVMSAIEQAQAVSNNDKPSVNLEYICTEFLATRSGEGTVDLKSLAKSLEKVAGVQVLICNDEGIIHASKELEK